MDSRLIAICHRCPHRQRPCSGPCSCLIDGLDITWHASFGQCPAGTYSEPPSEPKPTERKAGCGGCGGKFEVEDLTSRARSEPTSSIPIR